MELETGVDDIILKGIPTPPRWLAACFGRWRASGKVKDSNKWNFFRQKYPNFQDTVGGLGGDADNYSSVNFSAFAKQWNDHVASLGTTKPSFTYKTAIHLQETFKQIGINSRRITTLLTHT